MKAVFLDRDNTLIRNDGDLGNPDAVELLSGVGPALRSLRDRGYALIVVTNQGGVARGAYTEEDVDAVHQRIAELIDEEAGSSGMIERFYYCPYHPDGTVEEYRREHPWRKPQPGMLVQASRDLDIELGSSWLIGDQERDIEAGRAAGCRTVRLASNGEKTGADVAAESLRSAVDAIVLRDQVQATTASSPSRHAGEDVGSAAEAALQRAVHDLAEELRTDRLRRSEFTAVRMCAGLVQLLVILFALFAMMQIGQFEPFVRWMAAAVLAQLFAIALLLVDR